MKINTSFDTDFERIEKLSWLPWTGEKYFDLPDNKKLIVIGESHCAWDEGDDDENDGVRLMLEKKDFTRQDVNKYGMLEGWWKENDIIPRRVQNIEKLFLTDSTNVKKKQSFWQSICYFNISQKYVDKRSKRPQFKDYLDEWEVFYQIISILNPAYCLFVGVEASNHFWNHVAEENNYYPDKEKKELKLNEKIDGVYPRKVILKGNKGQSTTLLFINHTAGSYRPFSTELWKMLIKKEFKDYDNVF